MKKLEIPASLTFFGDSFPLLATKAVVMSNLFQDGRGVKYRNKDKSVNNWFSSKCSEGKVGKFRIVVTVEVMTLKQMAQFVTGNPTEIISDIFRTIVLQRLDFTPAQFDEQIIATEGGEQILLTNGWPSFTFCKTGKILKDKKGEFEEVVGLYVLRNDHGLWNIRARKLDLMHEYDVGLRLLLRDRD